MTESVPVVGVAENTLRRELTKHPSLEKRRRVQALLEPLDLAHSPGRLRQVRAVETLEAIASPPARQLLQKLAEGTAAAVQTSEAIAALERLDRLLPAKQP